jgi:hypothetical protein
MRLHPFHFVIFILVFTATCILSIYIIILEIMNAKPRDISKTPFKTQDRNLIMIPTSSSWKSMERNTLESKIYLPQRENNQKQTAKDPKRLNDLSSWPLSHYIRYAADLQHGSLSSKTSDIDLLTVLGGFFAFLFLGVKAKEKLYKQKRYQQLREFLHDSSHHDLMLDVNYSNPQNSINYGSFVPIQMGDLEKYDI